MDKLSTAARSLAARAAEMGIEPDDLLDFEAARNQSLERRMALFFRTHKPGMDGTPFRSFDSTAEYRRWCNENTPMWLGYHSEENPKDRETLPRLRNPATYLDRNPPANTRPLPPKRTA